MIKSISEKKGQKGEREGGREGGSIIQSRELHTGYKN